MLFEILMSVSLLVSQRFPYSTLKTKRKTFREPQKAKGLENIPGNLSLNFPRFFLIFSGVFCFGILSSMKCFPRLFLLSRRFCMFWLSCCFFMLNFSGIDFESGQKDVFFPLFLGESLSKY